MANNGLHKINGAVRKKIAQCLHGELLCNIPHCGENSAGAVVGALGIFPICAHHIAGAKAAGYSIIEPDTPPVPKTFTEAKYFIAIMGAEVVSSYEDSTVKNTTYIMVDKTVWFESESKLESPYDDYSFHRVKSEREQEIIKNHGSTQAW